MRIVLPAEVFSFRLLSPPIKLEVGYDFIPVLLLCLFLDKISR